MEFTVRNSWGICSFAVVAVLAISCGKSQPKRAESGQQRTFASPSDAGAALLAATTTGDPAGLIAIFGPDSRTVLFTDEAGADRARMNDFIGAYNKMHRWSKIRSGAQTLMIGPDNFVFPIPLGQNSAGRWYFDTAAGKDEILARRIGKSELNAMDGTEALAGAERQYFQDLHDKSKVRQYAQKFVSDPNQRNGLFWPVDEKEPPSPMGRLGDFAKVQSAPIAASNPEFNGYRYRILNKASTPDGPQDYVVDGKMTGGFAILAYPTDYRNSGIMSFMLGQDGALYQKDLGERTTEVAASLTAYNPSDGWTPTRGSVSGASRMKQPPESPTNRPIPPAQPPRPNKH